MEDLNLPVAISGVTVPLFVYLVVEALKAVELVKADDGRAIRVAVLATSLIFSALWAGLVFFPGAAPVAGVLVVALVAALSASAAYNKRKPNE